MTKTELQQIRKNGFREYVEGRWDYISKWDILQLNKNDGWGCTIKQCIEIYNELFGD